SNAGSEMVGEVGANPRQIVPDRDADRLQMGSRPDARDLQQVRRIHGAARDDDLACCQYPIVLPVLPKRDPDAPAAVQHEPRGYCLGHDPQIWPSSRLCEKGARGRSTKPATARHLRIADTLLNCAIVVMG